MKDIKVIHHNMGGIDLPDDLSYPYLLEAELSVGGMLCEVALHALYGSERIKIRGRTLEVLEKAAVDVGMRGCSRLYRCVVTGPKGQVTDLYEKWRN